MIEIIQIPILSDNYTYLLYDPRSLDSIVIDPGTGESVLEYLTRHHLHLSKIINTHHHHDHIGGNSLLQTHTRCDILCSEYDADRIPGGQGLLKEGFQLTLGESTFEVLEVPGHTHGHIALWNQEEALLFSGDTLFPLGCGRVFEGTPNRLYHTLQRLASLPPSTLIYGAHEYTLRNIPFALAMEPDNRLLQQRVMEARLLRKQDKPTVPSTLKLELETNPFLRTSSLTIRKTLSLEQASDEEVFCALRTLRNRF